jgi:hypothetical protein
MWEIEIVCSDPECEAELLPLWVEDLGEADRVACGCGCAVVAVRVAVHEPELPVRLRRVRSRELALR